MWFLFTTLCCCYCFVSFVVELLGSQVMIHLVDKDTLRLLGNGISVGNDGEHNTHQART